MTERDQSKLPEIENLLFEKIESLLASSSKVAVAVSGGADSMALLVALNNLRSSRLTQLDIDVLTVDHKLRAEAEDEALMVANFCKSLDLKHQILIWDHDEVGGNIQKKARQARFDLMQGYCIDHGIEQLFLAHHRDDLVETFLMRLKKGSDLKGLSSIAEKSYWGNNDDQIRLCRPFLNIEKSALVEYMQLKNVTWVEDSSNQNELFERVQVRNLLREHEYLADNSIDQSISRISDANEALEYYADQTMDQNIRYLNLGIANFDQDLVQSVPKTVMLKILARLIWSLGGKDEPTRWQKIEQLYFEMKQGDFKKSVLGHCIIIRKKDQFWFGYENRAQSMFEPIEIKKNSQFIWQNRLKVYNGSSKNLILEAALEADLNDDLKLAPKAILKNIPKISVKRGKWWQLDVDMRLILRR